MDITIIIPTYNREWALQRAINSCHSYTLQLQIIVVDDGSTDNTQQLLATIPGIEIYREAHWGKPWAVNMAFKHAKGKYIKFLDSDDWLIDGILEKQFRLAEQENADVVVAGYQLFDESGFKTENPWIICDDFIAQNLGECDSSHYSAFLFNREFIKNIPHRTSFASANFASRDDRCFMLEVALNNPNLAVTDTPALCHLEHNKGRLQFKHGLASVCTNFQHLLIYKNILYQLQHTGRLTQRRIDAACGILWPLAHWIAKDSITEAVDLVNWLNELNPNFTIPEKGVLGFMYKTLGFKNTEKILRLRRFLKYEWQ
ncbi:MAG TPA: glycosyltransferase family 2 protein [Mucilaginibacter sp.]|jgi:glycosyltransferase involved in cell wall biosynthesis|nr:glycosyltransferase family 2 protein [Mucilaginibacter sp.]